MAAWILVASKPFQQGFFGLAKFLLEENIPENHTKGMKEIKKAEVSD